ncbi:MAG: homoserine kinase [Erysipelotrichaceae bacterium]|nr:homoserine kinase [Erysipelotrichaceae bacterium]
MITIQVPATSANLGSGFDTLGIALNLYAKFTFEKSDALHIEGCDLQYANENNLIYQSYAYVFTKANTPIIPIHLVIDSPIPLARGLGSSATCIVAGVLAANYFLDNQYTIDEVFQMASDIEGHPDNIAPCMFGSFTASSKFNNQWICTKFNCHPDLKFYACIPNFELSTKKSREVLPSQIDYKQAVSNLSKLAFVIKGFEEANEDYLQLGLDDNLHQPYRFPIIHDSQAILEYCKTNKLPVYLSGAGPTIMIVTTKEINLQPMLQNTTYTWKIVQLQVDTKGYQIYER